MQTLSCCWPWLFAGLAGGWLLWQLFDRFFRRDGEAADNQHKRDFEIASAKLSSLQGEYNAARASLSSKNDEISRLQAEIKRLGGKLSASESQVQATSAAAAAASALAAAGSYGFAPQRDGQDDLAIIEGIGPKIKELLHADGIKTFKQLAEAPVERIQAILDAAGPNFRLAKPASWARQAAMCVSGDWAGLKAYQDQLNAGVDPDAPKS